MPKSFISEFLPSLRQAQQEFAQAMGSGKIWLIDSTFQGANKQVGLAAAQVEHESQTSPHTTLASYLQDLKHLGLPQTPTDIYTQFFGPGLSVQTHHIQSEHLPDLSDASLVILSGSPANVTDAINHPDMQVVPGTTHAQVLQRESQIIRNALKLHIPIIGICYGHQILGHLFGGQVGRLSTPIVGVWNTQPTPQGLSVLNTYGLDSRAFKVSVPAYHQDVVERLPGNGIPVLEANTSSGNLNYGLMYPEQSVISVQYHPEYLFLQPLLTAYRTQQPVVLPTAVDSSIETLKLFTAFLKNLSGTSQPEKQLLLVN